MAKTSLLNPFKAIKFLFEKPVTLRYPFETKEIADRYRGFHNNDWDKCTGCGNCADICPNKAIEMIKIDELTDRPEEGMKDERPQIDYGRCCFCGLCVDVCPPGSLTLTRDFFHIHFDTDTFTFIPKDEKTDKETYKSEKDYSIFNASLTHRKENYQGFSPDMQYALFEPDRIEMPEIEPDERKLSFVEQVIGYSKEQAREEAGRCLECKLCEAACPAHLKISDYMDAIYRDEPKEALEKIFEDNPIPSICGRICMAHCEDACSLHIRGDSLAIRWIKRYAADQIRNFKEELEINPGKPTGKKIGIIGAGPSGLSLAYFLRLQGHDVVVYDQLPGGGGAIRIGPPAYRLPLEAIDKDVDHIKSLGVEFNFNTKVGKDITFEEIYNNDAVFMGIGNTISFSTRVPNAEKCILALDYLKDNKIGEQRKVGKEVIVIGGGNVAMDVARETLRFQHIQYPDQKTITKAVSLEDWDELPATDLEVKEAKEEGIEFNPAWGPKEVVLDEVGNIKGLECKKVKSVFNDEGRFAPTFFEEQTKLIKADMIIEAIGQKADFSFLPEELNKQLEFTERRKVKVDENGMTTIPKLFAGGDIVNVNLDAVTAIADAKIAAEGINNFLKR